MIALSTDKASSPPICMELQNCADKLILSANIKGRKKISSVVSGNVTGSRGSVVPFFLKAFKDKKNYH